MHTGDYFFPGHSVVIDGQAQAWPFTVFTPKQGFGPRTAKFPPIWIKLCIHLLQGVLWADLDRDWHVGGSRPNQNDYVFVILVTHPKSYIETTDRRDFGATVKVEVRTGVIVKYSGMLLRGRSQIQKQHFRVFMVPFDYPAHSLRKQFYPKPMVPMESREFEGVPFASLESL